MQNKTKPQIFLFPIIILIFLSFFGCSDTPTNEDKAGTTITPIATTEITLKAAGAEFLFVKVPVIGGHLWISKRELSREQYDSLMNTSSDSAKYPKSINWYAAARVANKLSEILNDTLINPLYTDTNIVSIVQAVKIDIAGYVAAFDTLPSDSFKNLPDTYRPLRITQDSLLEQIVRLDSLRLSRVDTLAIKNALLRASDSVYISVKNDSVLLSVRHHIRKMTGPAIIDTMLADTMIKVLNAAKIDTPFTIKTVRHTLTNSVSGALTSWNIVYFPVLPPDSVMKLYPSIVMPAPCTLNTYDAPVTIRLWNRSNTIKGFRLPTRFEWEQAALCGINSLRYSTNTGNLNLESAVYGQNAPKETYGYSERVPNPNGLTDMTGNLYEWVEDWYYKPYKALKGGYYGNAASDTSLISLYSTAALPDSTYGYKTGVRLVIESTPAIDSLLLLLKP
jgi:hypothetical protein